MNKLPMNLPNKITIARILLIPLYLALLVLGFRWAATLVFAIAAGTDWLDGRIARKYGMVTNFGKFMDPIADKLLALLPMIYFAVDGSMGAVWAVMIMVAREIIISGFRLVAVTRGTVIAAGWSGKIKTTVQLLAVLLLTLGFPREGWWVAWIATALSVYSGFEIIVKNIHTLEEPE